MFHVQRKIVPFSVLVACNEYTWILVGGLSESVICIIYCLKVWCWVWSSDGWSQPWYWILAAVRSSRRQVVMDPHLSIFTYSTHPDNCIYLSRTEKHPLNGHLYKQCQHDCIIYYWQYDSYYTMYIIYTMIMYNILLIFIFSISNNYACASSPHEAAVCLAVPAPAGHHAVELLVVDAAVTVNVRLLSHGI